MARRLPPLNSLKAFEAAARHESFVVAADELRVTHGAVSRHVGELEKLLGEPLFTRTGRGVKLTAVGAKLGQQLTPLFDKLENATRRFPNKRGRARLRLSCEQSFATLWLAPRVSSFTQNNPDIELIVDPDNHLADYRRGEADAGIRWGKRKSWEGIHAIQLMPTSFTPVCNPALLRRQPIEGPLSLARHTLFRLQEGPEDLWASWFRAAGLQSKIAARGPVMRDYLAVAAAERGQGIALADEVQAADGLLQGRLTKLFNIVIRKGAYYLVRAEGPRETETFTAFRSWVDEQLAETRRALAPIYRRRSWR